jgi:hypothetical protein
MVGKRKHKMGIGTKLPSPIINSWLEWAGARLIALPGHRTGPADIRVIWPEYDQEKFQVLEFRRGLVARSLGPTNAEMPFVEEILRLPNLCSDVNVRRVLHKRALIHPTRGTHIYRWDRIAKDLGDVKLYTVKRWHKMGLIEVGEKINLDLTNRLMNFFDELGATGYAQMRALELSRQ